MPVIEMNETEYRAMDRVCQSDLCKLDLSPAHLRDARDNPKDPTHAMLLGTALHSLVLQPELDLVQRAPKIDKRTKAGKEEWAAFQEESDGKIILKEEDYFTVQAMAESIFAHPAASKLVEEGESEQTLLWEDPITGEACKARCDLLDIFGNVITDIKTTRDASPSGFCKSIANLRYYIQCAFYTVGASIARFPNQPNHTHKWNWIAVESSAPYNVAVYQPDAELLEWGEFEVWRLLELYKYCKEENVWPGYSENVETISMPLWARRGE